MMEEKNILFPGREADIQFADSLKMTYDSKTGNVNLEAKILGKWETHTLKIPAGATEVKINNLALTYKLNGSIKTISISRQAFGIGPKKAA